MRRLRQEIKIAGYVAVLAGLTTVGAAYRVLRVHHEIWKAVKHDGHSESR